MDTGHLRERRKEDRYTGLLIGSMLSVFVGMLLTFTIFLAPVGLALITVSLVVAGYAAYQRGDFEAKH